VYDEGEFYPVSQKESELANSESVEAKEIEEKKRKKKKMRKTNK